MKVITTQDCKYLGWKLSPSSDNKLHGLLNYNLKVKLNCIYYLVLKKHIVLMLYMNMT